jgi:hypothetical protein
MISPVHPERGVFFKNECMDIKYEMYKSNLVEKYANVCSLWMVQKLSHAEEI